MKKHTSLILTFLCVTISVFSHSRPDKPNVVLILADDLGWQDLGCYDIDDPSPYETPYLDKFSETGVKFWQAYSPAATCAPSRGAIIAGKFPTRLQRTHVVGGHPAIPYRETVSPTIEPWYSGRLPVSEITIPETLHDNGYTSGHVGKWHIAIGHHAYPQPEDHGFDFTIADRGVTNSQKPTRISEFSTSDENDPYSIDKNGFPRDPNNENAIAFMEQSKCDPFFLYYAPWLVHAPIHTRSKRLLHKYCTKMNVPFPTDGGYLQVEGQGNPYYAAMVEMLDYYVGQVLQYLEITDDPRWKGHKLIENTYIIFTSDNGGMEGNRNERYTDNFPLDKGKINAKEGGIRVPLIISGPDIASNQESNTMINGVDFFPTILAWTNSKHPNAKDLDGIDLSNLLATDVNDKDLLRDKDGEVRHEMVQHFPHGGAIHSTIRIDDYKLIHNYVPGKGLELYRLYDGDKRVDIEEMNNLASELPDKALEMDRLLTERLTAMNASYPFLNPNCKSKIEFKEGVCKVINSGQDGNRVWVKYEEQGNSVTSAYLVYTLNGGKNDEEWYRLDANIAKDGIVSATLPKGASHYVFNLVDEHQFMVSYPHMGGMNDYKKGAYANHALAVE